MLAKAEEKQDALSSEIATAQATAKAQRDASIKTMLDKAVAEGRLIPQAGQTLEQLRGSYETIGQTAGVDVLATALAGLGTKQPIAGVIVKEGKESVETDPKAWADVMALEPTALAAFRSENKETYAKLFKAEFGHAPKL